MKSNKIRLGEQCVVTSSKRFHLSERIIITTGTISHWTTGSEHYRYTSDSISIYARSIEEKIQDKGCV